MSRIERDTLFGQAEPPPAYGAPTASAPDVPQEVAAQTYHYQQGGTVREIPVYRENVDAYVYLALSMVLTVLLMFSGPGVIAVICTAMAYCGAKEAIRAGEQGWHEVKAAKLRLVHNRLFFSCCCGGCFGFLFFSFVSLHGIQYFSDWYS